MVIVVIITRTDLCTLYASLHVTLNFLQLPGYSPKPFLRPHKLQRRSDKALLH
jgi:hypothetical protein